MISGGAFDGVWQADEMTLKVETLESLPGLADAIVSSIRDVTKLRGDVEILPTGTLPNDGKLIDDTRALPTERPSAQCLCANAWSAGRSSTSMTP